MRLVSSALGLLVAVSTIVRVEANINLADVINSKLTGVRVANDDDDGFKDHPDVDQFPDNAARKLISIDDDGMMHLNKNLKTVIERTGLTGQWDSEPIHIVVFFGKFKTGKSLTATMLSCALAANCDHCHKRNKIFNQATNQVERVSIDEKPGGCHREGHGSDKPALKCSYHATGKTCADKGPGDRDWEKARDFSDEEEGKIWDECDAKDEGQPVHYDTNRLIEGISEDAMRAHTGGLWTSPYIDHRGKRFLIFDMEGLELKGKVTKERRDAVTKMVAMLSEVASVFVMTMGDRGQADGDIDLVGRATSETREHLLVQTDAETMKEPPLRSHNKPSLLLFMQTVRLDKAKDSGTQEFPNEETRSRQIYQHLGSQESQMHYQSMLENNFKASGQNEKRSDAVNEERTGPVPWTLIYTPKLYSASTSPSAPDRAPWGDLAEYDWQHSKPFPHGEGCVYYENMTHKHWDGKPPAWYAESIRRIADMIDTVGVERQVSWGGAKGEPLTSKMFWAYLNSGIAEMNKVRPLPDDEMWRLILSDGCASKCEDLVNASLGWKGRGALAESKIEVDRNDPSRADGMADWIERKWQARIGPILEELEVHYQETFPAVQDQCRETVTRFIEKLKSEKAGLMATANLHAKEHQLAEVQAQLDEKFWENNKMYITIWGIAGSIIALVMMRMFRQINMTCRQALGCCGNCFGSSKNTKIVYTNDAETGNVQLSKHTTTETGAGAQLTGAIAGAVTDVAGAITGAPGGTALVPGGQMSMTDIQAEARIAALEKMITKMYIEKEGASSAAQ